MLVSAIPKPRNKGISRERRVDEGRHSQVQYTPHARTAARAGPPQVREDTRTCVVVHRQLPAVHSQLYDGGMQRDDLARREVLLEQEHELVQRWYAVSYMQQV